MPVLLVEVSSGVVEPDSVLVAELVVLLGSDAGAVALGSISGKMNRLIKKNKILTKHKPRTVNFSFAVAGTGFGTGTGLMISLKVP
jgi:hypothetical protein